MLRCIIRGIEYHLPEGVLTNEQLAGEFPEWDVDKIEAKTGISSRHIAGEAELSSDLAFAAARKLFASKACGPQDIDFLLFCTQTPDQSLPTTACLLQHRLELRTDCGALDFNLGCSGFVYGLSLAKGLIESGQARNVLLLTAETYSKLLDPKDKAVRTLFGDGAAATLLSAVDGSESGLDEFVFGTDGIGGPNLICPRGAFRTATGKYLTMNGPEIFNFTIKAVPEAVKALLARTGTALNDIDMFIFHQANTYMLEHLRKKIGISKDRFVVAMADTGNTVSATIPIAMKQSMNDGRIKSGMRIMVVGFGVGYSWAAATLRL